MKSLRRYTTMTRFFILFSFFVFTATIILVITTWYEVKAKAVLELNYTNKMISRSFSADLQQHEILLRLLGEQLLAIDVLHNPQKAKPLIEKLLGADKSLAGFGVARPNGQLILVSFVKLGAKLPNLATSKASKTTFKAALTTEHIALGHTYYMKQIKKWVVPLRLPIYDKFGTLIFIMTSGIDIDYKKASWQLDSKNSKIINVLVSNDNHFIFSSMANTPHIKKLLYDQPIPESTMKQINPKSLRTASTQLFDIVDRFDEKRLLLSTYNSKFSYISATAISYNTINKETFIQLIYFILGIIIFYVSAFIFYFNANIRDKKQQAELRWTASHDLLTKLPNRYFLQQRMQSWNRHYKTYTTLFMDLDNFKDVNDNYGHPFGDKLLIIIAQRLKSVIETHEHVIRQGGDEFIILTSKDETSIIAFVQHILHVINEVVYIDNITLHPKISIGIAHYPEDATTISALLSKADMALYKAKENKSGFYNYSHTLEEASSRRLEIELELQNAITNSELYVLFQPQMDATSLKISGVEALVRWENPSLGFMPPDQFIAVAEDTGHIHKIGAFVLQEACKTCLEIYKQTNITFTLSVNASVNELLQKGYVTRVLETLERLNFPKELLIIEVTESLLIHDVQKAKQVLNRLKSEGIELSLDDFGTGYSSLSMLNGLPVNELKIDQSFIKDILIDSQDLALTKSIITLGKLFNLKTVAEGVEELGHVVALQEAGCSILQGYYFAKPLAQKALLDFIQTNLKETPL